MVKQERSNEELCILAKQGDGEACLQLLEQNRPYIVEQMKKSEGITEALKEQNQMEWIQRMQSIEARASEIISHDIIFN